MRVELRTDSCSMQDRGRPHALAARAALAGRLGGVHWGRCALLAEAGGVVEEASAHLAVLEGRGK